MDEILEGLSRTAGISGSMVVGKDGLVISQAGRLEEIDTDLLGATASELYMTADAMMGDKFKRGSLEGVMLEAGGGKFMLNAINEEVFLLVMCKKKLNLGLARWEVQTAAGKLKEEM